MRVAALAALALAGLAACGGSAGGSTGASRSTTSSTTPAGHTFFDLVDKKALTVGKAKTVAGTGRVIPLNETALAALVAHAAWYTRRFGDACTVQASRWLYPTSLWLRGAPSVCEGWQCELSSDCQSFGSSEGGIGNDVRLRRYIHYGSNPRAA